MMKDSGYIDTDVKIEDHIDSTVYKQALDELIKENPDDSVLPEPAIRISRK